ncbi:class I SAM-dependent methyltransferase [Paenibacillus gorillae]|uniref:class I SAM-dependent methyltransferase n=1 Tax=Paenibacillus gorillae TaxID=1243662 RepID=UPI0004B08CDA|nr:class I SAM-dependent methyltransferase [Paenibacillus gorillae]
MEWKYYEPHFAADSSPRLPVEFMKEGAWSGHRRFAYDLVRFAQPRVLVELGTLYGTSFFSFCQAVKDGSLPTRCFAVDTWEGDPHTGSYSHYSDVIYEAVHSFTTEQFSGIGATLRGTFQQALPRFALGSIDLLHIDGYHTYDAVLHDLSTWLPKMADNSIILFHDIAVRSGDFGVYKLWEQLRDYPRLQFNHSNGLGVLFPKGCPASFQPLLHQQDRLAAYYEKFRS